MRLAPVVPLKVGGAVDGQPPDDRRLQHPASHHVARSEMERTPFAVVPTRRRYRNALSTGAVDRCYRNGVGPCLRQSVSYVSQPVRSVRGGRGNRDNADFHRRSDDRVAVTAARPALIIERSAPGHITDLAGDGLSPLALLLLRVHVAERTNRCSPSGGWCTGASSRQSFYWSYRHSCGQCGFR